jgi:hypothetical protein
MRDAFIRLIAASLKEENFTLVDIGCSGGIEPVWRLFGERLAALAFDASISECRRLQAEETHPNVRYVAAFVGIPPEHPFAVRAASAPQDGVTWNTYLRTSAAWATALRTGNLQTATDQEKMQSNLWTETELADAHAPVVAPRLLDELGIGSVDLLKIDVDGPDFLVLNSFDEALDTLGIVAVRLEVNFNGAPGETSHVFHNTDCFMRSKGYSLAGLDSRPYSMKALPARFSVTQPAETVSGRVLQGDAFYIRDIAAPGYAYLGATMSAEKILKIAAIFSAWDQPDGAAEVLVAYRQRLSSLLDVDLALDLLAAQAQYADGKTDEIEILSYRDYMAAFAEGAADFYPPPWHPTPSPTLMQRFRAAFRALDDWLYIERNEQNIARGRLLEERRRARAKPR